MLHSKEEYNRRIQDSAGIIPNDEPVFLLRAQDAFAPRLVMKWAKKMLSHNPEAANKASRHAKAMLDWQREHGFKIPD